MPMTAISDLRSLAKDDPFFNELADFATDIMDYGAQKQRKSLINTLRCRIT